MYIFLIFFFFISFMGSTFSAVRFGEGPDQLRSKSLQSSIDYIFESVARMAWGCHGGFGIYRQMDFDEEAYARYLIEHSEKGSTIAFMDYGSGHFGWNKHMVRFLHEKMQEKILKKDIRFILVGVTGDGGPSEIKKEMDGHVVDYRLRQIKLENICEELVKRDLGELRFDLITTNWALRHLSDPLGSFKQCVDLLKVGRFFTFDGFFVAFEGQENPTEIAGKASSNMVEILAQTGVPWIWKPGGPMRSIGEGVLYKTKEQVSFPYAYKSSIYVGDRYQTHSNTVEVYKLLTPRIAAPKWWESRAADNSVFIAPGTADSEGIKIWEKMNYQNEDIPPTQYNLVEIKEQS